MNGIFKAVRNGSLTEIKELVADSIDINTKDSLGISLLYYAALTNQKVIVQTMIVLILIHEIILNC